MAPQEQMSVVMSVQLERSSAFKRPASWPQRLSFERAVSWPSVQCLSHKRPAQLVRCCSLSNSNTNRVVGTPQPPWAEGVHSVHQYVSLGLAVKQAPSNEELATSEPQATSELLKCRGALKQPLMSALDSYLKPHDVLRGAMELSLAMLMAMAMLTTMAVSMALSTPRESIPTESELTRSESPEPTKFTDDVSSPSTPSTKAPSTPSRPSTKALESSEDELSVPQRKQTVIILDWDDTLLPSHFLEAWTKRNGKPLPPALRQDLQDVEDRAIWLLERALQIGKTYIVTNAERRWVGISAAKYMPGLLPVLERIPVVSARDMYQEKFPGNVSMWKLKTFLFLQRTWDVEATIGLVAIGDSDYEMEAARATMKVFERKATSATGKSSRGFATTVKFREAPSPRALLQQLDLLKLRFDDIVQHEASLKVHF